MSLRQHTARSLKWSSSRYGSESSTWRHVDQVLESAGKALLEHDMSLPIWIIVGDQETDSMELEIDHLCLADSRAAGKPVAGDLRLLDLGAEAGGRSGAHRRSRRQHRGASRGELGSELR